MFLPVNKTVLVSSSGFWATAHTKAQLHNIDLISTAPDESASPFIGGIVNNLEVVFAKRMEYRPETVRVLVQRPSGATEEVVVGVDQGGNAPARDCGVRVASCVFKGKSCRKSSYSRAPTAARIGPDQVGRSDGEGCSGG